MTEDRLREIAFGMEVSLNHLEGLDLMLVELVENASTARSSMLYALLQRNLGPDLNRHSPDDIQIRGNRTTVPPPRERHSFRSHPMA